MEPKCFVIQPINDEKFTKRFDDVYRPAIEAAGFIAYRADLDVSVTNLIENIESKIIESEICLADISMDNPNVWYELGYAYASDKEVVMICDESRKGFPFDVRHKSIISYKTESMSDFDILRKKITEKVKNYTQKKKTTKRILESPIKKTDGYQPYELTILAFIIGNQYTDEDVVHVYNLKEQMNNVGYNDTAFSIGLRKLKIDGLITTSLESDYNGNEYTVCKLTISGEDFILRNTHLFDLGKRVKNDLIFSDVDDLPF